MEITSFFLITRNFIKTFSRMSDEQNEEILRTIKDVRHGNYEYMKSHPEIRAVLHEITQQILLAQPKDYRAFLTEFFTNTSITELQEKVSKVNVAVNKS